MGEGCQCLPRGNADKCHSYLELACSGSGNASRTTIVTEGVDSETYLLRCYRYIELNPLRARMVSDPADYRWSSFACNALAVADPLIRPHLSYLSVGTNMAECIRLHLHRQHAYGTERFREAIEVQLSRRAGPAKIGRPRKSTHSPESSH